jgi:hypothetical protein
MLEGTSMASTLHPTCSANLNGLKGQTVDWRGPATAPPGSVLETDRL